MSKGFNSLKTDPKLRRRGYFSIHAEISALLRAVKGDTLIVVRVMRKGERYSCSYPCEKCLQYIREYGIRKVIYTGWNGEVKEFRV